MSPTRKKRRGWNFWKKTKKWKRRRVAMQNGRCFYCGRGLEGAVRLDHVKPLSKGGEHVFNNVVAACETCDTLKGNNLITI